LSAAETKYQKFLKLTFWITIRSSVKQILLKAISSFSAFVGSKIFANSTVVLVVRKEIEFVMGK